MRTILNFVPVLIVVCFAVFLSFVCANVALIGVAFGSILLTAPALFCAGGFAGIAAFTLIHND
jgi:hypothetical protein